MGSPSTRTAQSPIRDWATPRDMALGQPQVARCSRHAHPVHVHLVRFQIVARNGGPPHSHEAGWKDTVAVSPGEDVRIIARFGPHRGRHLIHCHNLEHEDHDMMMRYDVLWNANH